MIRKYFKLSVLFVVASLAFVSCSQTSVEKIEQAEKTEQKIIFVKVPPPFAEKLSNEERYWRFRKFLFPQTEIPKKIPKSIPNDDSLFW